MLESTKIKCSKFKDYPILQEFKDVFLDEIHNLPLKRDIEFSIDLMLVDASISKFPYRMSTPKLMEMKMQLEELLEK